MIHETAIVASSATIGKNVSIGPWTTIGEDVEIGDDCDIASHVVIKGPTVLGVANKIYQFSTVGDDTPDLKYKGEHLVPVLVNAVQELTAMVKELQTEIKTLKG